jgi:hypothetical protein
VLKTDKSRKALPSRAELWSRFEKDVRPACLSALYTPTSDEIASATEKVVNTAHEAVEAVEGESANRVASEVASVLLPQNNSPGAGSYLYGAVRGWLANNFDMIPTAFDFIMDSVADVLRDENNKASNSMHKKAEAITERNLKDMLFFLERGDLHNALEVANKVQGPAALPLRDWKRDATARLVSEQVFFLWQYPYYAPRSLIHTFFFYYLFSNSLCVYISSPSQFLI